MSLPQQQQEQVDAAKHYLQDGIASAQNYAQENVYPAIRSTAQRLPGGESVVQLVQDNVIEPSKAFRQRVDTELVVPAIQKLDQAVVTPVAKFVQSKSGQTNVTELLQTAQQKVFEIFAFVLSAILAVLGTVAEQPAINPTLRLVYVQFYLNVVLYPSVFNMLARAPGSALHALNCIFPAFNPASRDESVKNIQQTANIPFFLLNAQEKREEQNPALKIVSAAQDATEAVVAPVQEQVENVKKTVNKKIKQ